MNNIVKVINWDLEILPNSQSYFESDNKFFLDEVVKYQCPVRLEQFLVENIEKRNCSRLLDFSKIDNSNFEIIVIDLSERTDKYIDTEDFMNHYLFDSPLVFINNTPEQNKYGKYNC